MRASSLLIACVLLATAVLLNLPAPAGMRLKASTRDALAPFQNVLSALLHRAGRFLLLPSRGVDAAGERERMLTEIADLRMRLAALREVERENEQLRKLVAFRRQQPHKLILCEVVAHGDAAGWWRTLAINRGSEDGLRPDMPVISVRGVVGRTREVTRRTSTVELLSEPGCRVACRIARTGALGIARGRGSGLAGDGAIEVLAAARPLQVDYIAKDAEIRPGDEVVTSGLGGVFPDGLPLGSVRDVELDVSGLYQRATVVPAGEASDMRYLFAVETAAR